MTVERGLRLMAGVMVLISLLLAHFVSLYWLVVDSFRRAQSAAVRIHQLVPGHAHIARDRIER